MFFNNNLPIYVQIIDLIYIKILKKEWLPLERVPSVRDLASFYQVNPNTVMRAYEKLQGDDIIFNKRGLGYFLSVDASCKVSKTSRASFIDNDLPEIFKKMESLYISMEQLSEIYGKWKESR